MSSKFRVISKKAGIFALGVGVISTFVYGYKPFQKRKTREDLEKFSKEFWELEENRRQLESERKGATSN